MPHATYHISHRIVSYHYMAVISYVVAYIIYILVSLILVPKGLNRPSLSRLIFYYDSVAKPTSNSVSTFTTATTVFFFFFFFFLKNNIFFFLFFFFFFFF